jgi:hypothetical protein
MTQSLHEEKLTRRVDGLTHALFGFGRPRDELAQTGGETRASKRRTRASATSARPTRWRAFPVQSSRSFIHVTDSPNDVERPPVRPTGEPIRHVTALGHGIRLVPGIG